MAMESPDPISDLGLDCPFNGTFYICKDSPTRFIGCCTLNPCGDRKGLCPDEHLEPATYDSRYRIPPQGCVNDNFAVSWYTCPKTNPPFLGCCAVDPYSRGGCPDRELRAAKLSDKSDADLFVGGKSPSSDSKGSPSVTLSITTATLTASYISTKAINAGIDATSDSEYPPSHPASGKKGLSSGAIAGICVAAVVVLSFIIGGHIARFYWHHKRKKFRNPNDKQPSSCQSTATSSISRSQKRPHSIPVSMCIINNSQGHITGIDGPSWIPFGQNPGQEEIHTRISSEEQHHQQESRERWTQQPQPGQDTVSRPNFPVQTISVQVPSRYQNSRVNPSTPQPPYLTSDDQNKSHQGAITRQDHREYKPWAPIIEPPGSTETPPPVELLGTAVNRPSSPLELPGNTGRPHSTGHPSTSASIFELPANTEARPSTCPPSGPVNNSWLPHVEPPANTETPLPTAPPSTPVVKSSSPGVELPANTEVPLSTNPPNTPGHRLSDDTIYHKPEPESLVFPPRPPPVVRPGSAPLSDIPEEQPVEHFDSRNTAATRSDGQLNHGQSRSADELRRVARSRGRSWSGEDYTGYAYPRSPRM
ncbi:hypothetical protein CEP53_010262 [Fusarium sp. AF-6]|nr:hypothetical protein CEP53_010262 [Fusarium sp. AF-6]